MPDIRDKIADAHAAVEEVAENALDGFRSRMAELLGSYEGRMVELWSEVGVPEGFNLKQAHATAVPLRDEEWMLAMEAALSAAKRQAFYEMVFPEVAAKIAKHSGKIKAEAKSANLGELKAAAAEGVGKARFNEAKERRKNGPGKATEINPGA